ncbi:IPT/TIG domain-containing protein, partial [Mycobacterium sp.]|uniref:IPT/TIG domain-containing protein n=1 Tax=Mycobacterium sp. TaxID=1785 RepID=UPI003F968E80
ESSFAWYRGPFTPVDPQPLPAVGDPPVDPRHATTADALMIYLAEEGLFDLSYSAAWNIGRELALADSQFAQTINRYRQVSRAALGRLSQRLMMPHFSGHATLAQLAAPKATRAHFSARIGDGLGYAWTRALASIREGARPASPAHYRTAPVRRRPAIAPREVLAMAGAAEAVTENVGQELDAIAAWLANLSLLRPVPFSHLVPDSRMLPTESIRFFYVDQGWIDAAVAGALSLAVHGSADLALLSAVRPHLDHMVGTHRVRLSGGAVALSSAGGAGVTGLLIRSLLVSGWPDLVVTPTLGGAPLPVIRDDCPSPAVRLSLFQGVPDTVRLSEPYQSLRFGVEDGRIYPRCVTLPAAVGAQITNATPVNVAEALRTPATGAVGGVLHVGALAAKLQTAADVLPFAAGAVVQWNGTNLQTTFVSDRQLTAAVPAGLVASAGTAAVTAVTGGATSAPVTFTIDAALAVDSLTPSWIGAGTGAFTLTVRGQGFGTDAVVHCNGTALTTRVVSMMEVTASVPSSAVATPGTATITVTSGTATSNPATLTVVGAYPGIDSLEPNLRPAGADGFTLTVLGSGFAPDSQVQWNGSALTTRIEVAGRQLAAAVPARLIATKGTASVTVAAGGLPSQPAAFTIAGPNPTLGGLRPAVALAGGAVVTLIVDGVNFASGATVNWNGTPLTTTFDDSEQVTATVPASLLAVAGSPHAITVVSGGMTSNALPFAVIAPQPAIGLLEPNTVVAGAAAFTLTVTAGFGSGDYALQMVRAPESQAFIPIT